MKGTQSIHSLFLAALVSACFIFSANAISAEAKTATANNVSLKPHAEVIPAAGVINLNKADAQTLAQLNGVGEAKAEAIIAYRQTNGGFKSVDDLLNVKGIGEKILEKNRTRLTVN